jgi:SAM-dependent methyltransferase
VLERPALDDAPLDVGERGRLATVNGRGRLGDRHPCAGEQAAHQRWGLAAADPARARISHGFQVSGGSLVAIARKLHLGCFDVVHDGWLNTDVTPHLMVARVPGLPRLLRAAGGVSDERWAAYESGTFRRIAYLDLTRAFPFADASIDAVLASHVLEHLTTREAEDCVAEIHRVLRPGGVVRVAVPDLDTVVAGYDPADPDAFLDGLLQGRERSTSRHRHWWNYNENSMRALLRRTGFADVARREFGQGRCPDVQRVDTRPASLFMEAVR